MHTYIHTKTCATSSTCSWATDNELQNEEARPAPPAATSRPVTPQHPALDTPTLAAAQAHRFDAAGPLRPAAGIDNAASSDPVTPRQQAQGQATAKVAGIGALVPGLWLSTPPAAEAACLATPPHSALSLLSSASTVLPQLCAHTPVSLCVDVDACKRCVRVCRVYVCEGAHTQRHNTQARALSRSLALSPSPSPSLLSALT